MKDALLRLHHVTVKYGNNGGELVAVRNVSLDVTSGEVVAIVGRSGCGKTTLLKTMAGLVKPVEGEVIFKGRRVVSPPKGVGVLFQTPLLLPWRNVLRNVLLPIEIAGEDIGEYVGRAAELLDRVGLKGFEGSYPWELSGGMQQRAALCRALIHKPSLLLLDEPFSALDAITREEMWILTQEIISYEGYTAVLVTHDVREAVLLSDRVVVVGGRPGTIKAEVSVPFTRPRGLELQYSEAFNELVAKVRSLLGD
ncbi:MAG: ABC transporter ATP-binding protein [Zestosphaera sp.]